MAVRLDHNFPPAVSYRALALDEPSRLPSPSGGDGGGETPVPIPNTAVKPSSADGTAWSPCGRVGRRRIISESLARRDAGQALVLLRRRRSAARRVRGIDPGPIAQGAELVGDPKNRVPPS